jgi:hypothetical protein
MENLEQILKHWEKDSNMDGTEPSKELLRIPILHSKYLNILTKHRIAVKKATFDYHRMRKLKWEYYTGKMSQEDLVENGWEPFQFTLKSDVTTYLEADSDLIKFLEKKAYHEESVAVLEAIMGELKSRTFQLRDYISWEKFVAGT